MSFFRILILQLGILVYSVSGYALPLPVPSFEQAAELFSESGYFKLSWDVENFSEGEQPEFELQQSGSSDFSSAETIYTGPDKARFFSGFENGKYHFRVRSFQSRSKLTSTWSTSRTVRVKHHSLVLGISLFSIGGIVFILTVLIVWRGHIQARKTN